MPFYNKVLFFILDTAETLPSSKVKKDMNTMRLLLAIMIAGVLTITFVEGKSVSTGEWLIGKQISGRIRQIIYLKMAML